MIAKKIKLKKNQEQSNWPLLFLLILFLSISGFLIFSNWKITQKKALLTEEIEALQKEIKEAEKRNRELKIGISQVGTEDHLEKMAREQFNLRRPGEELVVIKREEPRKENEEKEKKNFWQNFWQNFLEKIGAR